MDWLRAVERLRTSREAGVLVTVASVRGHAPRDAGAKMVVSATRTWGTVGGGNLEEVAIDRARAICSAPSRRSPSWLTVSLSDKAPYEHGVQCCGGEVDPPARAAARRAGRRDLRHGPRRPRAGPHPGPPRPRAAPGRLPRRPAQRRNGCAVLDDAEAHVHVHQVPVLPELVLGELPRGTHVLVMTHDHAEDVALCDAALRSDHLASIGLIGSRGQVGALPEQARRRGPRPRGDRPDHHPHRRPGHQRQGPGLDRGQRRGRPAPRLRARAGQRDPAKDDPPVTLFRGTVLDTPDDPFAGGRLRADLGRRAPGPRRRDHRARRTSPTCARAHPDEEVVDLSGGLVLPGFVDTHVHFPQVRAIGGLGMPLLDWLDQCALPEEARLADVGVRRSAWPASSSAGWPRPAPPRPWSSVPTSRRPSTPCSPRRRASGCG